MSAPPRDLAHPDPDHHAEAWRSEPAWSRPVHPLEDLCNQAECWESYAEDLERGDGWKWAVTLEEEERWEDDPDALAHEVWRARDLADYYRGEVHDMVQAAYAAYAASVDAITRPRTCHPRRMPAARPAARRPGTRTRTSSRAGPDDPDLPDEPEPPPLVQWRKRTWQLYELVPVLQGEAG